jgi:hypothetical protein
LHWSTLVPSENKGVVGNKRHESTIHNANVGRDEQG